MQYDFTQSLGMRLEAERYRISDAVGHKDNVDLISLGLVYTFGRKAPEPAPTFRPAAVTTTPPAAAPPPPPPKVAPPPPAPQVVTPPPPPPPRQQAPVRRDRF